MDEVLVTASSIAALLFFIWIAFKNTVRGLPARGILAVVSIVTLALEPIRTSVALGQINLVLAALVAAGCLMSANRWAGGILVGVAAAVKLTPLVFILFFILKKDWRNTLSSLATVVVLHGAAFLVNPAASLQY